MEPLLHYSTELVKGLKPLSDLVPGKALLHYMGSCLKRIIDPYLIRHQAYQNAKTQQMLIDEFPLKRIEITQEIINQQANFIPDVAKEAFENAMKIGNMALGYINASSNTNDIHCQSYDKDWMNMYIDEAKYVSDNNLQQIFARLLMEKICNPNVVNKRVLNIIRNIDSSELETIEMYMSCFIDDYIPIDIMHKFDFGIEMMMTLQNIGVVSLNNAPDISHYISRTYNISPNENVIQAKGYSFIFDNVVEKFEIDIPSYFLTKEGRIIYKMINVPMREDVVEMYKEIFLIRCKGKADLTIVKE